MQRKEPKKSTVEELAEANRRLLNRENELQGRQFYQETYNRIVTGLIASNDLKQTLGGALGILCESTESSIGAIYLHAFEEKQLIPFTVHNLEDSLPSYEIGAGLPGSVAKEKKRLISGDIPPNFPFKIKKSRNVEVLPRTILLQPLLATDRVMGVLFIGSPGNYSRETVDLVDRVSVQIALAIVNAITLQRAISLARELQFKTAELKKKYVELEKAHQAKSTFLAGVSHELRTPLTAIIGFSRVLLKKSHGELNPEQGGYIRLILKNGEHLLAVINDILDLSRVESGKIQLTRREINLRAMLEECARSLQPLSDGNNIRLSVQCGDNLAGLRADRRKLKQIVFNLLSNAIKFSPAGGAVEVKAHLTEYGDEVKISVSDQGPGIPPQDRQRIFEPFIRVSATKEGTGLGLAVTRRLVELHGGQIWVESVPGQGSTFFFTLPLAGFERNGHQQDLVKMRLNYYE